MARLTYLDLVRGICAIAVLVVHYRWFYAMNVGDFGEAMLHPLPLQSLLMPLYLHGGWAVQAFWVLSGVIYFIKNFDYGKNIDGRKFAVWRIARLYPLHLATLILVAVIQLISVWQFGAPKVYGDNTVRSFVLQLFFAAHWLHPKELSFNAPIWSVSIEIIAYVLFYLTLRFAGAKIVAFAAMFVLLTIGAKITGNQIFYCASLFFLGCLTAYMWREWSTRTVLTIAVAGLLAGIAALVLTGGEKLAFYYLVLGPVMLLALTADKTVRPVPDSFHWLGDVTYSTYLCHMPILMLAKFWLDGRPDAFQILSSPVTLFLWLAVVVGVGYLVHRFFELKSQEAIQNWYRRRSEAQSMERMP